MHSLTIQGAAAPAFYMTPEQAQDLCILIQGLTGAPALVVSSRHRTDILYSEKGPRPEVLQRFWSMRLRVHPDFREVRGFVKRSGDEEVVMHFFTALQVLAVHPIWYQAYLNAFQKVSQSNPTNPILKRLIECDAFLRASNERHNHTPLTAPHATKSQATICDIKSFVKGVYPKICYN